MNLPINPFGLVRVEVEVGGRPVHVAPLTDPERLADLEERFREERFELNRRTTPGEPAMADLEELVRLLNLGLPDTFTPEFIESEMTAPELHVLLRVIRLVNQI